MARLALVAVLLLVAAPVEASHGKPYSANVRHARQWSRSHVNAGQWPCLDRLWHAESGWSVHAGSPSGPYGIPQANPGRRMRAFGDDWRTNGTTQVRWGVDYIRGRYGTMCHARAHQLRTGWY